MFVSFSSKDVFLSQNTIENITMSGEKGIMFEVNSFDDNSLAVFQNLDLTNIRSTCQESALISLQSNSYENIFKLDQVKFENIDSFNLLNANVQFSSHHIMIWNLNLGNSIIINTFIFNLSGNITFDFQNYTYEPLSKGGIIRID